MAYGNWMILMLQKIKKSMFQVDADRREQTGHTIVTCDMLDVIKQN